MRVHYSILLVSDMNHAVAFYRDVVGMPLRFETPGWTEFGTAGATFALHKAGPEDRPGTCRPGVQVPDLDAFHKKMLAAGVECLQPPTEQFGARLAQYAGPDGIVLGVGEGRA